MAIAKHNDKGKAPVEIHQLESPDVKAELQSVLDKVAAESDDAAEGPAKFRLDRVAEFIKKRIAEL